MSNGIDIKNGALVHRHFDGDVKAELLGVLQYDTHALTFVAALLAKQETAEPYYVVTNTYDGSQTTHRKAKPK